MLGHSFSATALPCGYRQVAISYQTRLSCVASVLFDTNALMILGGNFSAQRGLLAHITTKYPADRKPQGNRVETRSADQPMVRPYHGLCGKSKCTVHGDIAACTKEGET